MAPPSRERASNVPAGNVSVWWDGRLAGREKDRRGRIQRLTLLFAGQSLGSQQTQLVLDQW
jgi:hypothetical protein